MGLLERNTNGTSRVRTRIIRNTRRAELLPVLKENVELKSSLYSDAANGYTSLNHLFVHSFIDHAQTYVRDNVHTNGIENFWALLKRTIGGTYVSVEPFHLFRYLDEQAFRFNNRAMNDAQRFVIAAASIFGRRLTYEGLTGHAVSPSN
jgi:transposase-like protein